MLLLSLSLSLDPGGPASHSSSSRARNSSSNQSMLHEESRANEFSQRRRGKRGKYSRSLQNRLTDALSSLLSPLSSSLSTSLITHPLFPFPSQFLSSLPGLAAAKGLRRCASGSANLQPSDWPNLCLTVPCLSSQPNSFQPDSYTDSHLLSISTSCQAFMHHFP